MKDDKGDDNNNNDIKEEAEEEGVSDAEGIWAGPLALMLTAGEGFVTVPTRSTGGTQNEIFGWTVFILTCWL